MKIRAWFPAIASLTAVVTAIGCSSSSAPSDPLVGNWSVQLDTVGGILSFAPDPLAITITRADIAYSATYPDVTAKAGEEGNVVLSDTSTNSAFTVHGDTLLFTLGWAQPCSVSLTGTVTGNNAAAGIIAISGAYCSTLFGFAGPYATGTWTATRH